MREIQPATEERALACRAASQEVRRFSCFPFSEKRIIWRRSLSNLKLLINVGVYVPIAPVGAIKQMAIKI